MNARSPEELDTLIEDAVLLGDVPALLNLYDDTAHVASVELPEGYVAGGRVTVLEDVALSRGPHGVTLSRRRADGSWCLLVTVFWNTADDEVLRRG